MLWRVRGRERGRRGSEGRDALRNGGEREVFVVGQIQFAAPSIKQLYGGCPCRDLCLQIGNRCLSDTVAQFAKGFWLMVEENLYQGKYFLGFAFHHVAGKCPPITPQTQNYTVTTHCIL